MSTSINPLLYRRGISLRCQVSASSFFCFSCAAKSSHHGRTGAQNGTSRLGYSEIGETWLLYGGFQKWGYPEMDGLWGKNLTKMDDLGLPLFWETSICCYWLVVEPPLWKKYEFVSWDDCSQYLEVSFNGVPKMDGLQWENPIRMDDFAVPCGTPISGSLPNMGARYTTKTKFYCLQPLSQLWWLFLMRDFWPDAIWGFPQMGVPAVIIHL